MGIGRERERRGTIAEGKGVVAGNGKERGEGGYPQPSLRRIQVLRHIPPHYEHYAKSAVRVRKRNWRAGKRHVGDRRKETRKTHGGGGKC